MIKIAIIEDEPEIMRLVADQVKERVLGREDVAVYSYTEAEKFLEELESGSVFHIVFSDIEMPGTDGLVLGARLKQLCPNVYLVYLSAYEEYAVKSYYVEAYQYILKQDMGIRLPVILDKLLRTVEKEFRNYVILKTDTEQKRIYYTDVIYIQKVKGGKYVEYVLTGGAVRDRITMQVLMEKIRIHGFLQVERGCAVNIRHIVSIKGNVLILSNGAQIVISRLRLQEIKKQIARYWGEA